MVSWQFEAIARRLTFESLRNAVLIVPADFLTSFCSATGVPCPSHFGSSPRGAPLPSFLRSNEASGSSALKERPGGGSPRQTSACESFKRLRVFINAPKDTLVWARCSLPTDITPPPPPPPPPPPVLVPLDRQRLPCSSLESPASLYLPLTEPPPPPPPPFLSPFCGRPSAS